MFKIFLKFRKHRKAQDIIDNIVALGIFTIAFLYVVYVSANSINPVIETSEYVDVQLTAFSAIEKIISDPTYGIVSRDHVVSYDKLVDFASREDSYMYPICPLESSDNSYISLLKKIGLIDYTNKSSIYDLQIMISSTYIVAPTLGIIKQTDIDDFNYSLPTIPIVYTPADNVYFNTDTVYIADKYYEFLVVDEDKNGEYDHVLIDVNQNRDFQDEVTRGFYGVISGTNNCGFIKDQNFSLESKKYIITDIYKSGQGVEILNIDAADKIIGARRNYSDIVLVVSRLVLVDEFGTLSEKRVVLIMWEGNRLCSWIIGVLWEHSKR